jgi:hypothetical protein
MRPHVVGKHQHQCQTDLTEEEIEAGTHYSWNEETTSWDKVTRT